MSALSRSAAWRALERHAKAMAGVHLRELFAAAPDRFPRFSLRDGDLLLDYSKNRVTEETIGLLLDLAREDELEAWRARMFAGDRINTTENRAVLHVRAAQPFRSADPDRRPGRHVAGQRRAG